MDYTYNSIIKPSDLITYLSIGDQDIDLVEALCDRATKTLESLCNRTLIYCDSTGEIEITEYHSGKDNQYIFLDVYPIKEITSIKEDVSREFGDDSTADVDTYTIDSASGMIESDTYFGKGNRNIQVVYKGGYTQATIPKDLVQVCIEIAALLYKGKDTVGVSSKSFSDGSAAFFIDKLTPFSRGIISYYVKPLRNY
jgi:hypothetical protein